MPESDFEMRVREFLAKPPFCYRGLSRDSVDLFCDALTHDSYSNEAAHVTLCSGKVEVLRAEGKQVEQVLQPGQDAWFGQDGALHVAEVDVYDIVQWKDGFFYFNDKSLVTVLRELGRWYNLGVVFRNASAMNYKVHFSALREGTINEALSSLNSLRKVKVSLQGNNIVVE